MIAASCYVTFSGTNDPCHKIKAPTLRSLLSVKTGTHVFYLVRLETFFFFNKLKKEKQQVFCASLTYTSQYPWYYGVIYINRIQPSWRQAWASSILATTGFTEIWSPYRNQACLICALTPAPFSPSEGRFHQRSAPINQSWFWSFKLTGVDTHALLFSILFHQSHVDLLQLLVCEEELETE